MIKLHSGRVCSYNFLLGILFLKRIIGLPHFFAKAHMNGSGGAMSRSPKSPSLFGTAEGSSQRKFFFAFLFLSKKKRSQRKCLVRRSDSADEMAKKGSAIAKTSKLAGLSYSLYFGNGDFSLSFFNGVRHCPCSDSDRFLTRCRNIFLNAICVKAAGDEVFFIWVLSFLLSD